MIHINCFKFPAIRNALVIYANPPDIQSALFFIIVQLPGSSGTEYHFRHSTLPHARTRRSISHTRILKKEPLVSSTLFIIIFILEGTWLKETFPLYSMSLSMNNEFIFRHVIRKVFIFINVTFATSPRLQPYRQSIMTKKKKWFF
jgi:hypothetical protein